MRGERGERGEIGRGEKSAFVMAETSSEPFHEATIAFFVTCI